MYEKASGMSLPAVKEKQEDFDLSNVMYQKVVRANELVQKQRLHMTRQELCMLLYMISKIRPGDDPNTFYEFDIDEFMCLMAYETNSITKVAKAAKELSDKSFWLDSEDERYIRLTRWFKDVYFDKYDKSLWLSFDEFVRPHLFNLVQHYSSFNLVYCFRLSGYYTQILYGLLRSFSNNTKYYFEIGTNSMHDIYRMLSADPMHDKGVPKAWLRDFGNFRTKVLEPAVKDINRNTDLTIAYELSRTNMQGEVSKKYQLIIFQIHIKTKEELAPIDQEIRDIYKDSSRLYIKKMKKKERVTAAMKKMGNYIDGTLCNEENGFVELSVQKKDNKDSFDKLQMFTQQQITPLMTESMEPSGESEKEVCTTDVEVYADNNRTDDTPLYVSDENGFVLIDGVLTSYCDVVSSIQDKTQEFSNKEIACMILEAKRHIGKGIKKESYQTWIDRYIDFYLTLYLFNKSTTKTSGFNRLLNYLTEDYKDYASVANRTIKKEEGENGNRDLFGKSSKAFCSIKKQDYSDDDLNRLICNQ